MPSLAVAFPGNSALVWFSANDCAEDEFLTAVVAAVIKSSKQTLTSDAGVAVLGYIFLLLQSGLFVVVLDKNIYLQ